MGRVIGIANFQKGVGKTTTATYLAESFASIGNKVLMVHVYETTRIFKYFSLPDSLSQLSSDVSSNLQKINVGSRIWDLKILSPFVHPNLDLLNIFQKTFEEYDIVLVDFPRHRESEWIGLFFKLIHSVIVPVEGEFYGLDGINSIFQEILKYPKILIEGVLINKLNTANEDPYVISKNLRKQLREMVFETYILRNYYLSLDTFFVDNLNGVIPHFGLVDYLKLANEIIEKAKLIYGKE